MNGLQSSLSLSFDENRVESGIDIEVELIVGARGWRAFVDEVGRSHDERSRAGLCADGSLEVGQEGYVGIERVSRPSIAVNAHESVNVSIEIERALPRSFRITARQD